MIVWGGQYVAGLFPAVLNDGGQYNPTTDSWTPMATNNAPPPRENHTAVWTGSAMIVWGGYNGTSYLNDTFSYSPSRILYLYQWP
jgi:N-acetylneuraminic acid mutarotase